MDELKDIEEEFIRIYERIVELRGIQTIVGRIMAIFFIEGRELDYQEISKLSGYSISSVGRALEQMVQLGILQKRKNVEIKRFVYSINIDFNQLMISVIERFMATFKLTVEDVRTLSQAMKNLAPKAGTEERVTRLQNTLANLEKTLEATVKYSERIIKELEEY